MSSIRSLVWGSQHVDAYSNVGLTIVVKVCCFTFWVHPWIFRLIKPSVLLALLVMLLMCAFQVRSLPMVTPRYLLSSQLLICDYGWYNLVWWFCVLYQLLGTDHSTCRGGGGGGVMFFFISFRKKISDNTRVRILIFFCRANFFSRIQH